MDPASSAIIIELAKISLQGFFNLVRLTGKTAEEVEVMYSDARKKFFQNDPANLPDPSSVSRAIDHVIEALDDVAPTKANSTKLVIK